MLSYNQSHIRNSVSGILRIFVLPALIIFFGMNPVLKAQESNQIDISFEFKPIFPQVVSQKYLTNELSALDTHNLGPAGRYFVTRGGINSYIFFSNLRQAANRTFLTRKLHDIVMRTEKRLSYDFLTGQREKYFQQFTDKTIRKISIRRLNVFGESIEIGEQLPPGSLVERIGNRLHIKTNTNIIKHNLLFSEGDIINAELLADNERLIRSLRQIEDARIYVMEDPLQPSFVDVVVVTRDYFSKGVDIELNEVNAGVMEFYDRNIAGTGREVQVNVHFDASQYPATGYEAIFQSANLFSTFIDGRLEYMDVFNDRAFRISLNRNFYTPNVKYAGGASFSSISRIDNFTYPDTIYLNHYLKYNSQDYWIARAFPLKRHAEIYTRAGIALSARVQSNVFYERPPISEELFYPFHNKNLWLFGLAWTRQNFYRSRYVYGLGQAEDIPIGSILKFIGGFEDNQFYRRWYLAGRLAGGIVLDKTGFVFASLSLGSFIRNGTYEQAVFSFENKWFSPLLRAGKFNFRQFAQIRYSVGGYRFEDEFITLSGRQGIRGLRSPEMVGRQKLVVNLESVVFSPSNILGLRFAYFTFADFGWIGNESNSVFRTDLYGGVGLGLKVRSELMVFPTLVVRFAYYPVIPTYARFEHIYFGTERLRQPDVFRLEKPDILPFR